MITQTVIHPDAGGLGRAGVDGVAGGVEGEVARRLFCRRGRVGGADERCDGKRGEEGKDAFNGENEGPD